jgi:hypothetical protein
LLDAVCSELAAAWVLITSHVWEEVVPLLNAHRHAAMISFFI